jgi:hypothetical protein
MNVVEKLVKEKNELYEIIKKNYIVPEVYTGYCQECHETQDEINNYKQETLEIPKPDNCLCSEQVIEQPQQNVPLFL